MAKNWTDKEIAKLISWYSRPNAAGRDTLGLAEIAAELGRDKANVCRKARALGLTNKSRTIVSAETKKQLSQRAKAQIASKGHPRGALGIKHSEKTKRAIAKKSRAAWKEMKAMPLLLAGRRTKTVRTNLQRYGVACPAHAINAGRNVYSRCRRGTREDLGFFVRSRWEANYARYLKWLEANGQIAAWKYEPTTFRFEGVSRGPYTYKPDFLVIEKDGTRAYHEVKGWMDSASRSRLKRFAKFYPDERIVVIDQAAYRQIERKLSSVIRHWESS